MPKDGHAVATFAGGCFWCMEPPFDRRLAEVWGKAPTH
jgi:peptide methionine sulfoxide reductase MsrA